MKIAFYCRVDGQGFGFVLPDEADKLREFFAEHQDKPVLENPSSVRYKFFVVCLTYGCRKSWKRILDTPALSCILCNLRVTAEVSRISPVMVEGNMYFDFGI